MNDLVAVKPESIVVPQPPARPIDEPAVTRTLLEIEGDSRQCPDTYLRDTVVPHGGE